MRGEDVGLEDWIPPAAMVRATDFVLGYDALDATPQGWVRTSTVGDVVRRWLWVDETETWEELT
jgi:hypothetical protein